MIHSRIVQEGHLVGNCTLHTLHGKMVQSLVEINLTMCVLKCVAGKLIRMYLGKLHNTIISSSSHQSHCPALYHI